MKKNAIESCETQAVTEPLRRGGWRWGYALFSRWYQRRKTRKLLMRLSAAQLRDIGLTRAEIEREESSGFWR